MIHVISFTGIFQCYILKIQELFPLSQHFIKYWIFYTWYKEIYTCLEVSIKCYHYLLNTYTQFHINQNTAVNMKLIDLIKICLTYIPVYGTNSSKIFLYVKPLLQLFNWVWCCNKISMFTLTSFTLLLFILNQN